MENVEGVPSPPIPSRQEVCEVKLPGVRGGADAMALFEYLRTLPLEGICTDC